jgi:mono/diheme cytochrome c family protein
VIPRERRNRTCGASRTGPARVVASIALSAPIVAGLVGTATLIACAKRACQGSPPASVTGTGRSAAGPATNERSAHPVVTPVEGPSWLRQLGLEVSQTQMGEMGGTARPPESRRREPEIAVATSPPVSPLVAALRRVVGSLGAGGGRPAALDERFQLTGEDLFRLDCQSCHGPDGAGAPPEIPSLVGPVRAISPASLLVRMKAMGRPIPASLAKLLASQARAAIRDRLAAGGEKMPPFRHMRDDEIDALLDYLERLAGAASPAHPTTPVAASAARVGEHLVKGTCHVCHDATGPGRGHMAMMRRIVPSLASFPRELSLDAVTRQVERGSSGMTMMMGGPQMPALPYVTEEEIAAAYLYLAYYTPQP